ncbi:MAG: extracellular solute-binding protein [Candidatus Levybacteria bacterium]|nr:extracellular solute-binding protein [Candidatus Levybacteria bacterium]
MDENVVFRGGENVAQSPVASTPEISVQNVPPLSDGGSSFPFGMLVKGFIGLLIIILIGFLVMRFVFPLFKSKNAENVTLVYWGLWEDGNVLKPVIADFQKQYPNIKIDYKMQNIKEYRERLSIRSENNNGPDIFRFHNTWLPMISKITLPLPSDVIKKDDFQTLFYPVVQTDLVKDGAIYGIPLEIDTLALFINPEIFQSAGLKTPTDWLEFQNAAYALTTKDETGKIKISGAAMGTFDNITHSPDIISLLLIQNGAKLINLSETSQNASDAIDFYTSFAKGDNNVWDKELDESIIAFAKGNLAMYIGYSWDLFVIDAYKKQFQSNLTYQIFPVPHLPKSRNLTIASYWVEGVSSKSKHQKEALLFMKYLAQKETAQKLYSEESKARLFGEPYGRVDLAESLKDNTMVYPFVSQGKDAFSSFFASDTFDNGLNFKMNDYLKKAIDSVLDNSSPQSAVDTLSKGVSQVLKDYGQ